MMHLLWQGNQMHKIPLTSILRTQCRTGIAVSQDLAMEHVLTP